MASVSISDALGRPKRVTEMRIISAPSLSWALRALDTDQGQGPSGPGDRWSIRGGFSRTAGESLCLYLDLLGVIPMHGEVVGVLQICGFVSRVSWTGP